MATDDNLIDFTAESPEIKPPIDFANFAPIGNSPITVHAEVNVTASAQSTTSKPSRTNKSLFAITREESHGESVGGDDSELDETLSESHDSSSTSILDNIKQSDTEKFSDSIPSTSSIPTNTTSATPVTQSSEPPSRFRIVKISKSKPYGKGKWEISDFKDSQKQTDTTEATPQPHMVTRPRGNTESSGEHKLDRTKHVTSATEPAKTKSSEFLVNHIMSTTSQSRGSSYNVISDRRSSIDR